MKLTKLRIIYSSTDRLSNVFTEPKVKLNPILVIPNRTESTTIFKKTIFVDN